MQETTLVYLLFDGIGPPCPGLKKDLSLGWGSYGSMEIEEKECGWLERQRHLKASMGIITVGKGEVV